MNPRVLTASFLALGLTLSAGTGPRAFLLMSRVHDPVSLIKRGVATNWAGYAAAGNLNAPVPGSVTAVSGEWNVPAVDCTSGDTTYAATWVGIDGYSNSTVEQLGTESDCSAGSPNYYAWFEMYPQPGYLLNPSIFPVAPGDHVTASVVYQGSGNFLLSIDSDNPAWPAEGFSIVKKANKAQRTTAEWILEAPGRSTLQLADFGSMTFTNASATIGSSGSISSFDYDPITKVGSQTATPSGLSNGGSTFSLTYGDSQTSDHAYVDSITYSSTRKAGGTLSVTTYVIDNLGNPVSGADVAVTVSNNGINVQAFSGATAADGTVTFSIPAPASGTYVTTVNSVTGGPAWDGVTPPNSYTIR